jgi:hypothetical protein
LDSYYVFCCWFVSRSFSPINLSHQLTGSEHSAREGGQSSDRQGLAASARPSPVLHSASPAVKSTKISGQAPRCPNSFGEARQSTTSKITPETLTLPNTSRFTISISTQVMTLNSTLTAQAVLDKALTYWSLVPQPAQWAFTGIGAIYVAGHVLSFFQLLLNCFVLSGTNVGRSFVVIFTLILTTVPLSASQVWQERYLGSRYRGVGRTRQGIRFSASRQRLQLGSRLSHAVKTGCSLSRTAAQVVWSADEDARHGLHPGQ